MRLFAGIALDADMRTALFQAAQEVWARFPGRFVDKDNYHCTLAFLGEVGKGDLAAVRSALDQAAAGIQPFSIATGSLSFFRQQDDALLFCGLKAPPALEELALAVHHSLTQAAFRLDNAPFRAHVTLARQARVDPRALPGIAVPAASQAVEEVTLFESLQIAGRLQYKPLFTCPLGKPAT